MPAPITHSMFSKDTSGSLSEGDLQKILEAPLDLELPARVGVVPLAQPFDPGGSVTIATRATASRDLARSLIGKADVFYTSTDNNVVSAYEALVKVGMDAKIPLVAADTDSVARGAVAAYGMDYKALGVQTGEIVVRILKGEKPGAIASETSNKLSLQVNPAAAQKQGITLAEDLVKSAAKVVQ